MVVSSGFELKGALVALWKIHHSVCYAISQEPLEEMIRNKKIFDIEKRKLEKLEIFAHQRILFSPESVNISDCVLKEDTISDDWNSLSQKTNIIMTTCEEEFVVDRNFRTMLKVKKTTPKSKTNRRNLLRTKIVFLVFLSALLSVALLMKTCTIDDIKASLGSVKDPMALMNKGSNDDE